jgi:hypothetical protein
MGIVLLPFLFLAIRAAVLSGIAVYKAIRSKAITIKHNVLALTITLAIYAALFASYFFSDSAYAFSPYFLFPFFMVLVPYILSAGLRNNPDYTNTYKVLTLIVLFSTVLLGIFYKYTFGIIQYLKLPVYQ